MPAPSKACQWITTSEEETRRVGSELAGWLAPDGILLLSGDLGSGKTVLAQGVAAGLGIDPRQVQSPTFTLVREHRGKAARLVHIDLYRLAAEETLELGLEELFASDGVKVVEWAERLAFEVAGALRLVVLRRPGGEREIRSLAPGEALPAGPVAED